MAGRINREVGLKDFYDAIRRRLDLLENKPFVVPQVAVDPTILVKGQMWVNTTTNLLKIVDKNGTIRVISWT